MPLDGKSIIGMKSLSYCSASDMPAEVGVVENTVRDVKFYTGLDAPFGAADYTRVCTIESGGEACPCMRSMGTEAMGGIVVLCASVAASE